MPPANNQPWQSDTVHIDRVRLRTLRGDRGWTAEELARRAGMADGTGPRVEFMNRARREVVDRLAHALGVSPDVLIVPPGYPGRAGEPPVPTEAEIAKLPRWAQTAFAARCARRVLAGYRHPYRSPRGEEMTENVIAAVRQGEQAAATATAVVAHSPSDATLGAACACDDGGPVASVAAIAARVARDTSLGDTLSADAARAAMGAVDAATTVAAGASGVTATAVRRDFDALLRLSAAQSWSDHTPVPPEVFGPLWPDEVLADVPAVRDATRWLRGLMGEFSARARVEWSFVNLHGFPTGCRATVSVREFPTESAREFTWVEVESDNYLRGELAALWGQVLAAQMRAVLADASPVGAE